MRAEFEQHKAERDLVRSEPFGVAPRCRSCTIAYCASQCPQKKIKSLYSSGKRQLKQLSQSGMLVGVQGDRFRGTRKAGG